ncbi:MAG: bifunctional adenosylcobinamide kinase/adenosylcobinamide-phosphate guanylyltransferase [Actinomycetota bacterium]
MITLVLGGVRSGKSELAERLAARRGPVTYVATGPSGQGMEERIAAHRARRPADWGTVEVTTDGLARSIASVDDGTLLVDSLGTWVAGHHELRIDAAALLDALSACGADVVLVSDEVGLSVHPETELGRHFQDVLGALNRSVSAMADRTLVVVAGRVIELGAAIEEFE